VPELKLRVTFQLPCPNGVKVVFVFVVFPYRTEENTTARQDEQKGGTSKPLARLSNMLEDSLVASWRYRWGLGGGCINGS
jgi:hypothetical protein